jgi:hypothetical protein
MLMRLKPFPELACKTIQKFPEKCFTSKEFTFLIPMMGGGQYAAEIEKRLRQNGHSDANIHRRVFGFETEQFNVDYAVNSHKLVGTYQAMSKEKFMKIEKKFDGSISNHPYKQGLCRELMEKTLTLTKYYSVQTQPDMTIKTSKKYENNKKMLEEGHIQEVIPCHQDFRDAGLDVITSAEICMHVFDKTKPFNALVFNKSLSKQEKLTASIIKKFKNLCVKYGSLTEKTRGTPKDKKAIGEVKALTSVEKKGPKFEKIKKNEARCFDGRSETIFWVNRFWGKNVDDHVFTTDKVLYVRHDNMYGIGNVNGLTTKDFEKIYLHSLIRFVLAYYRGTSMFTYGWSIRELPKVPASTKDLYKFAGLTQDEIDHVETNSK